MNSIAIETALRIALLIGQPMMAPVSKSDNRKRYAEFDEHVKFETGVGPQDGLESVTWVIGVGTHSLNSEPPMADRELTPQQRSFVENYIESGMKNAASSFRAAYPASRKWSAKSVAEEACRLLGSPKVRPIIEAARGEAKRRTERFIRDFGLSREDILQHLASLAFANVGDYAKWDEKGRVEFTPSNMLTERQRAAIQRMQCNANGTVILRLEPKLDALMSIARMAGMLDMPVKDRDEEDPEVLGKRAEARAQMMEMLRRMAVPEALPVDYT